MKRLEELDISPAPWKIRVGDFGFDVVDINNEIVVEYQFVKPDIRLIATSPKLYEVCYRIERWEDYAKAHRKAIEPWSDIMHDLHKALAEAAGEEVDDGNR